MLGILPPSVTGGRTIEYDCCARSGLSGPRMLLPLPSRMGTTLCGEVSHGLVMLETMLVLPFGGMLDAFWDDLGP